MAQRIDVHHHYIPLPYLQALEKTGAILSMTAPGTGFLKGAESAHIARECNEFGKSLRDKHPKNHGFFATLPDILDTEATLKEIQCAFDNLQADGFTLFTRYGNGNYYLGHPAIQPIWQELNRRAAVVFNHPTLPVDTNLVNKMPPHFMIDYPHETTGTAVDLITTDTLRKYSNCKIILSHGGGSLPWLARRPAIMLKDLNLSTMTPEHFIENARIFYHDLALTDSLFALPLLQRFAPSDHILFGSDFPYAPRDNALKLFPRLSSQ
ncbi:hypothetical protein BDV32DRAFT_136141 [Aspergillus pseudonomiae]|nr:hypothetical protein BDV32DRAFT_136141 [Aspergillus pseudonomiae]